MSVIYRIKTPIAILVIVSILVTAKMYVEVPGIVETESFLVQTGNIVAGFATIVAVLALMARHARIFRERKKEDWWLSGYLILLAVVFAAVGITYGYYGDTYRLLYNTIIPPIDQGMWALLGMFTFSAAARALRVRKRETVLLIVSCLIVICGNMPLGDAIWPGFGVLKTWLLTFPTKGANRGFGIGTAIGATIITFRTIMGKERNWLGVRSDEVD